MRDDLSKAEFEWKNRRLFRPPRRFRLRALLLYLAALVLILAWIRERELYPWLERIIELTGG